MPFGDLDAALANARKLIEERAYPAALAQAEEIRKRFPQDGRAAFIGAVARNRLGEHQAALKELRRLAKRAPKAAPGTAPIHHELGLALRANGKLAEATSAFKRAVKANPKLAAAWQALGELLAERGDDEAADAAFRQQMAASGRHPGLRQAVRLVAEGKLGMAEGILRDYLHRWPTDVNAIRLLADIALQLEAFDDAVALLRRCLELAPDYLQARSNYANALSRTGDFQMALREAEALERLEPRNLSHPVLAASVLVNVGAYEQAIARYERVLKQAPGHARLQMSYGHALKTLGRQPESIAAYRRAVEAEPSLGEAWWNLANLKTFRFEERDLAAMRRLAARENLTPRDELHLGFALGKALEDADDIDGAFAAYARGNAVKRAQSGYSADVNSAMSEALAASSTRQRFAARKDWGHPDPDPMFIVGLPRSGSTLLEQILASHSQVDGTMELPYIPQIARRLAGRGDRSSGTQHADALWRLTQEQCRSLGAEFLEAARLQRGDAPFFIDKLPNNFAHVGLIHLILPNARIIDARRHPMATCFSCFKQLFAAGQEFTYSLADIGRYYRDYAALMAHWDAVLPGRVLRVDYERVVEDLEGQVRRLLDHCGLPFEAACLAFHRNSRPVRTASSEQVRQPIYRDAMAQWRRFEAHLEPLKEALGAG
ncbi:MAG: sulfotransferase [Gammaproteobacteria bacterium]|nr:sulfotransferase [Gammaproteobacteria bacterium]